MKTYVRVTALILALVFIAAAAAAAVELWREGEILYNPRLKTAAGWLMSGMLFLAIGLKGFWRR
jgi:hypothetical protein